MLNTRLNILRATRLSTRGGFTLVELLVVIGIIAILAGVALGPITNGIKKAKQSSGLQSAHAIGLALYSCANDNSQTYPDKSGGGATAGDVASTLLAGGYVTDATIFSLSGDQGSSFSKVSSTSNTATSIKQAQVSWDFLTNSGSGVDATKFTYLPVLWSTVATDGGGTALTSITPGTAGGTAITATPGTNNPFGTDGMALFYINNSAAFVTSKIASSVYTVNMVTPANNLGGTSTAFTVASGN